MLDSSEPLNTAFTAFRLGKSRNVVNVGTSFLNAFIETCLRDGPFDISDLRADLVGMMSNAML